MSVGSALIGWRGYAAAFAIGVVIAAPGATVVVWKVQAWRYGVVIAEMQRDHAKEREDRAAATVRAIEAAREEGKRRTAAVEKTRDDAQKLAAAAAADAAGARADRDRMRSRADSLARTAAGRDPTLAAGSPAGAAAVDLLAYMLGRAVDRAEALAGIADRSRLAGLTCERAYDSLTSPK